MVSHNNHRSVGRPREFDEQAVLNAAMDVFWRKGFEAASLADLCKATGLHKGSLYSAFGDKHQLFMRALEHYSHCEFEEVMEVVSMQASPLQNIRNVVAKIMATADKDKGCMMVNTLVELAPHDEIVRTAVRAFGEKRIAAVAEMIAAAQQAGEVRQDLSPRKLAMHLTMTIAGANTMMKGMTDKDIALEILNDLISCWT